MFSDEMKDFCKVLSGVSLPITIECNQKKFKESLLFTHRGISGPAVLQISNYWKPGDNISINLLPEFNAKEKIIEAKEKHQKITIKKYLNRLMPKALVEELQRIWWLEYEHHLISEISNKDLKIIGSLLNNWVLKPSSTEGYRTAEVTLGGVNVDAIDSKTMETKLH